MSIDYDWLRELVDAVTPGPWLCEKAEDEYEVYIGTGDFGIITEAANETDGRLIALAPDMARELLRLRDGVEQAAGELNSLATLLARDTYYSQSRYVRDQAKALTGLLNGDTE